MVWMIQSESGSSCRADCLKKRRRNCPGLKRQRSSVSFLFFYCLTKAAALFVDFVWSKETEEEEQGQRWRRWEEGGGDSAPIQAGAIWPENELFLLLPEEKEGEEEEEKEEVWKVFLRRQAEKRSSELRRRLQREGAAEMLPAHGGKKVGGRTAGLKRGLYSISVSVCVLLTLERELRASSSSALNAKLDDFIPYFCERK